MSAGAKCSYVVRATAPASTCTFSLAISAHKFLSRRLTYHCKMHVKYSLKFLVALFSWQITTVSCSTLTGLHRSGNFLNLHSTLQYARIAC